MIITKREYEDYLRLKHAEQDGHLLTTDGLRFIIAAHNGNAEEIGKHFLEIYGKWNNIK